MQHIASKSQMILPPSDAQFRFCFTLDTEPDNLWGYNSTDSFEHFKILPGFHRNLLNAGARPTYLTTSEVVETLLGRSAIEECLALGQCEIGAHFHSWTRKWPFEVPDLGSPPVKALAHRLGSRVEMNMLAYTCEVLLNTIGIQPRSHRGGRWSFGEHTPEILSKCGIWVDSTVTPGLSWHDTTHDFVDGPDNRGKPYCPYYLKKGAISDGTALVELPVGAAFLPGLLKPFETSPLASRILSGIGRRTGGGIGCCWLCPTYTSVAGMRSIMLDLKRRGCSVWVFVIHSSEIIPCEPLPRQSDVDAFMTRCLEVVQIAQELGAAPATLLEAARWMDGRGIMS